MSNIFEVNSGQNLSSATMEKDSPRYLQWKLSRLQEKYRNEREFWSTDCIKHSKDVKIWEDTIQALQLELAAIKERESQLINQLKTSADNNEKLVLEKAILEDSFQIKENKSYAIEARLELQLQNNKEDYEKTLAELKHEHEQNKTVMKADFEHRLQQVQEETDTRFKELEQVHQCEVKKLNTQYHEMEEKHKMVVENLRNLLSEKEEEQRKHYEEEEIRKEETRCQNVRLRKSLELKVEALKRRITDLKYKEDLTPKVLALENTVKEKNKVIGNKNKEIAALKKDRREVQEHWAREQDNSAVLLVKYNEVKDNYQTLEDDKKQQQAKLQTTTEDLNKAHREIANLTETIDRLKYKVKTSKLRAEVSNLETYQQRFKADLLSCMSVITEPQKLKRRIINLKKRYIDNDMQVGMDEETESAYQRQATIKLLNEKIVEVHNLKKLVTEKDRLLEKATKPAHERVKSWITKKVLRIPQDVTKCAEETPTLVPDDWQPPGLPNENITSPVQSCTDDHGIIHVIPFVDDGLPPVDS
ncbi:golgin subfamily A member 6-like protein 22 [Micropterus dolomieu]|uniref:golgin subfamily A member 6-like protein 22 n=1 Tax=Micropterus dolomieu TaxID=147949 RepID=UPI001E8DE44E|nr:golgin subfamily A member 6-like protein 22 [Micropterus dolomieu]